jgi:hypothetical protein
MFSKDEGGSLARGAAARRLVEEKRGNPNMTSETTFNILFFIHFLHSIQINLVIVIICSKNVRKA